MYLFIYLKKGRKKTQDKFSKDNGIEIGIRIGLRLCARSHHCPSSTLTPRN